MLVHVFQWPDDMVDDERRAVSAIEASVRAIVAPLDFYHVRLEEVASMLLERTFVGLDGCRFLSGRLRVVVASEAAAPARSISGNLRAGRHDGLRVRFTWTKLEADRRKAEAERIERERAERLRSHDRNVRHAAIRLALLERSERGEAPAPLTADELEAARNGMTWDQWGGNRHGRNGVCSVCEAGPTMWCDYVAHRAARAREAPRPAAGVDVNRYGHPVITVTAAELEAAQREPLNLNATRLLEEAERLGEFADREYRREVLGEFLPPSSTLAGGREANPRVWVDPIDGSELGRLVAIFVSLLEGVTAEQFLRGYVARLRLTETAHARGNNAAELGALLRDRQAGDQFYFVPRMEPRLPAMRLAPDSLADLPGTAAYYARRGLDARRRDAVDRLVRMILVANAARAYARAATGALLAALEVVLRAWASNPALVELDIESAPFGVDLAPPTDDAEVRFALLEIDTPANPR